MGTEHSEDPVLGRLAIRRRSIRGRTKVEGHAALSVYFYRPLQIERFGRDDDRGTRSGFVTNAPVAFVPVIGRKVSKSVSQHQHRHWWRDPSWPRSPRDYRHL